MATATLPPVVPGSAGEPIEHQAGAPLGLLALAWMRALLRPLASLKLTVALFAMSIFLVLVGTLAQVEHDIWQVIRDYFRVTWCWIRLELFFPYAFFHQELNWPDWVGFPFPGGWLIGTLLLLNLLSAHAVRFTVQARGTRLWTGFIITAIGAALTWFVIASAAGSTSLATDGNPVVFGSVRLYDVLWTGCVITVCLTAAGFSLWAVQLLTPLLRPAASSETSPPLTGLQRGRQWLIAGVVSLVAIKLIVLGTYLLIQGSEARISDSGLRILWQLSKGGVSGLLLLVGCIMMFKHRGGIVLIHSGIALLMVYELYVGLTAVEAQMQIQEQETVNYAQDVRTVELAIVDPSDPKEDRVIAIPRGFLKAGSTIDDARLPFVISIDQFYPNSSVRSLVAGQPNPATQGEGLQWVALDRPVNNGTDSASKVDLASAYVTLSTRTGELLGTWLTSVAVASEGTVESVSVGGQTYQLALRFARHYKPYAVRLLDVEKEDYVGTDTPRNYSSEIVMTDLKTGVSSEKRIWMNNPLRYEGETYYQSQYSKLGPNGPEVTTLQVVANDGWMAPYVACMLVGIGMLAHFLVTLSRFLGRSDAPPVTAPNTTTTDPRRKPARQTGAALQGALMQGHLEEAELSHSARSSTSRRGWLLPLMTVIGVGSIVAYGQLPRSEQSEGFRLDRFGELPVVADGRSKPIDSVARSALLAISTRDTFKNSEGEKRPAIEWLLDTMARPQQSAQHEVFRIENLEVLRSLQLEAHEGLRYKFADFISSLGKIQKEVSAAHEKFEQDQKSLSVYERKLLELERKIGTFDLMMSSFGVPRLEPEQGGMARAIVTAMQQQERLMKRSPPLALPPTETQPGWSTFTNGWLRNLTTAITNEQPNPTVDLWSAVMIAWADQNSTEFNSAVEKLHTHLADAKLKDVEPAKIRFEAVVNRAQPFYTAAIVYVFAFLLVTLSWMIAPLSGTSQTGVRWLQGIAIGLTIVALAVHTYALWARIVISGRPPVTNLYGSAVFIGWAAVVLGLILEGFFRKGIGNILGAVAGFASIQIAYGLAADGTDTMAVLQAVLDTQFWLTTHVLCISLGYSTTYFAGLLGIVYIFSGTCTPYLNQSLSRDLYRMIYGVLCFSILFSFVGTVLGGLWADDSWGRFWGWDPKENGALIIVLWNALALHARWGGLVKERGLAVLAVLGNIAVSWSWFGVNELGIGLHSYGFREGMIQKLGIFALSQLAVAGLGLIPLRMWWSRTTPLPVSRANSLTR